MNRIRFAVRIAGILGTLLLANCANQKPEAVVKYDENGKRINPYPPGSYDHFKAEPSYPKTYASWVNQELLDRTDPSNSHIKIDLSTQRGFLLNNGEIAIDYPICSGIKSRPTPQGTFYILEKTVEKRSNRYGKFYDSAGNIVNRDADAMLDPVPEGGRFEGAAMNYWMRLTHDGVGHHIGPIRRYPASHACVRGPSKIMPIVFSKVKSGTRVDIVE
jgi:hypothetical protein